MSNVIEKTPRPTRSRRRPAAWALRVITATGLAVDAWVHLDLASRYDPNVGTGPLSQGDLFRIEAAVSVAVAVALLVSGRLVVWILAWLVAASAVGAIVLYRYHDTGPLGPLPDMYEPFWYREKTIAALAEGVAVVSATLGLAEQWWHSRRRAQQSS